MCRGKAPREELLRFVASMNCFDESSSKVVGSRSIRFDLKQRMAGRGVYVHSTESCLFTPKTPVLVARGLRKASVGRMRREGSAGKSQLRGEVLGGAEFLELMVRDGYTRVPPPALKTCTGSPDAAVKRARVRL